jgi:hypothetical protein
MKMRRLYGVGQQRHMEPTRSSTGGLEQINRLSLQVTHKGMLVVHLSNQIGLLNKALRCVPESRTQLVAIVHKKGGSRI